MLHFVSNFVLDHFLETKKMEFINDDEATNIWVASSNGNIDAVKQILTSNSNIYVNSKDETGYTSLYVNC